MQGEVRIIGGSLRGRKLTVPDSEGLRPTPDRVRETLFNWLAPVIGGAYCLDLFAGSGALGFEAVSRGAKAVVMIDASPKTLKLLKEAQDRMKLHNVTIYQANAPEGLRPSSKPFDVVFLDPPFSKDLLIKSCFFLEQNGFLADEAYIYLEAPQPIEDNDLPSNWQLIKSQQAGKVAYHLAFRKR